MPELENQMLTVSEAAVMLRVSIPTIYAMIRRGELPCGRFGRQYRIYLPDIVAACHQDKKPIVKQ